MPCSGCAQRRQALLDAWHRIRGNTVRSDSVLLSGNRQAQAEAEIEAQRQREQRGPSWTRQMRRTMQP